MAEMTNAERKNERIPVPSDSFFGFRLLYGDIGTISKVSGTTLLGSIPILWYKGQKAGLLKVASKKTYSGIRRSVTDVLDKKNMFQIGRNGVAESRKIKSVLLDIHSDSEDPSSENEYSVHTEEEDDVVDGDYNKPIHSKTAMHNVPLESILLQESGYQAGNTKAPLPIQSNCTASMDQTFHAALEHNHTSVEMPVPMMTIDNEEASTINTHGVGSPEAEEPAKLNPQAQTPHQNVRFSDSVSKKSRSSSLMRNLPPNPEDNLLVEPFVTKSRGYNGKVKRMAKKTKTKLTTEGRRRNRRKIFRKINTVFEVGEIIKMEKMLVMAKELERKGNRITTAFTEEEPCDTRIVERWKEYIVVARSTGDIDNPLLIQFHTKRSIPDKVDAKNSNNRLDFNFNSQCLVGFYNSLDKTISIVRNEKVFILRCQTASSSVRWLTFLEETLGKVAPKILSIDVPGLKISLDLNFKQELLKLVMAGLPRNLVLIMKDNGYRRENIPVVEYLAEKVGNEMSRLGYTEIVKEVREGLRTLGFTWRHYDRLEWEFGETMHNLLWEKCMTSTHTLELRRIVHYPTSVNSMPEPTPVEGFLSRLTTKEGNKQHGIFRKQFFAFSYFYTSSHLLFFCYSHKSLPPLPYSDDVLSYKVFENDGTNKFETLKRMVPQIYEHNPFETDSNGHLTWLSKDMEEEEFWKRDDYATYEFDRKLAMIIRADAVIDLTHIASIKTHDFKKFPIAVDTANNLAWNNSVEVDPTLSKDCYFEINMKNNTTMVLRAPNPMVKEEWILRLTLLKDYWALRLENDMDRLRQIQETNMRELRIDDYTESILSDKSNWENQRGVADSQIHNITPHSIYRPIIKSGFLYQKPKKHSSFQKYFVVLVPGVLIIYKSYERYITGSAKQATCHSHYLSIPISDCYIYSGNLCEVDLIEPEVERNAQKPGHKSLPRVYNDGWISSDDDSSRCFTLWFGKKRAIAGKTKVAIDLGEDLDRTTDEDAPKNPGLIRLATRLGVTGRSMVFMCRSRQEKDLWVSNLYTQLERFSINSIDNL